LGAHKSEIVEAAVEHTVIHHTKMNLSTVKWAQWDKTQSRELLGLFICVCIALCTIVAHNIAQKKPDNFPPYPSDNHHCSDDVYLSEGGMGRKHHVLHEVQIFHGKGQFWWIGAPIVKYRHFLS